MNIVKHGINVEKDIVKHGMNVADMSMLIGKAMGLSDRQLIDLCLAATFHDIGKMKISEKILLKKGELTKPERDIIKNHPRLGAIALGEKFRGLGIEVLNAVECHHEWYNGEGYPFGKKRGRNSSVGSNHFCSRCF